MQYIPLTVSKQLQKKSIQIHCSLNILHGHHDELAENGFIFSFSLIGLMMVASGSIFVKSEDLKFQIGKMSLLVFVIFANFLSKSEPLAISTSPLYCTKKNHFNLRCVQILIHRYSFRMLHHHPEHTLSHIKHTELLLNETN